MKKTITILLLVLPLAVFAQYDSIEPVAVPPDKNIKMPGDFEDPKEPLLYVEQMAEFPGGMDSLKKFLEANLTYPKDMPDVKGRVIIKFVVERDGSLSNFAVLKSPHEALSAEALRALKLMPKWEPAKQNGIVVSTWFILPVSFYLK